MRWFFYWTKLLRARIKRAFLLNTRSDVAATRRGGVSMISNLNNYRVIVLEIWKRRCEYLVSWIPRWLGCISSSCTSRVEGILDEGSCNINAFAMRILRGFRWQVHQGMLSFRRRLIWLDQTWIYFLDRTARCCLFMGGNHAENSQYIF